MQSSGGLGRTGDRKDGPFLAAAEEVAKILGDPIEREAARAFL